MYKTHSHLNIYYANLPVRGVRSLPKSITYNFVSIIINDHYCILEFCCYLINSLKLLDGCETNFN